jgi:hypothetical protein
MGPPFATLQNTTSSEGIDSSASECLPRREGAVPFGVQSE